MTQHFHAYIDEAGDEGFVSVSTPQQGSSEWLVLAGVLVAEEDDLELSHAVDRLRDLLKKPPPKPLHFRKLRQHSDKRAAMAQLAGEPFTFAAVAIWKPGITSSFLRTPPYLYNYAARFLIERLSWFADDRGRRLKLFFEDRANTSHEALEGYMSWIQLDPNCSIRMNCIAEAKPVESSVKLAQVADFYASATAAAFEPDRYGHAEEAYFLKVAPHLYRVPNKPVLGHGLKIFPPQGDDRARYPWLGDL